MRANATDTKIVNLIKKDTMELKIALLPGDGIGPEIVGEAVKVLDAVAARYGHTFVYRKALVGAAAIDAVGDPYPAETHQVCETSDVVLFRSHRGSEIRQ